MKMLKNAFDQLAGNPFGTSFVLATASAAALSLAFISEYVFGLQPCILCLYQRAPFAVAIFLGLLSFWAACLSPKAAPYTLGLLGITFSAGALIAAYHTWLERLWWKSFIEGCAVPSMEGNITDVLAKIEATTDVVRCDEIAWVDPVLGLSMANYNVIFSLLLAFLAFSAACRACRACKN